MEFQFSLPFYLDEASRLLSCRDVPKVKGSIFGSGYFLETLYPDGLRSPAISRYPVREKAHRMPRLRLVSAVEKRAIK